VVYIKTMKAKPIPTSPKNRANDEKEAEVEAFLKEPQPITKPNITRFSSSFLILTVIISFLAGLVGAMFFMFGKEQWQWLGKWIGNTNQEISVIKSVPKKESSITNYAEVVDKLSPNVVSIYVRQVPVKKNAALLDQLYLPGDRRGIGTLLTEDGIGVTTRKAIPDLSKEIAIITSDKTVYLTKVFYPDPASDIVLFKISGKGFPALDFADASALIVPQTVLDISRQTTTQSINVALTGLISLRMKRVNTRADLIESSEKLNNFFQTQNTVEIPGVSTFSLAGKIIGIHTGTDGEVIPGNIISNALDSFNKTGAVTRNVLGVKYLDLQVAKGLLLSPANIGDIGALLVSEDTANIPAVGAKSPAGRAGLKSGDIIKKINDQQINGSLSVAEIIQAQSARATITIQFSRNGKEESLPVTLDVTAK